MSDEGLHEIQLNGKQLVFLFMTATVVAVVIFLCGVMVGRGVRAQQVDTVAALTSDSADPTAALQSPVSTTESAPENAPLSSQETLTYAERLEAPNPPEETLIDPTRTPMPPSSPAPAAAAPAAKVVAPPPAKPTAPAAAPAPVAPAPAATAPAPAPARAETPSPASTALAEPPGGGFVVQVAAVTERGEADTIARRLGSKGYPAFVTTPAGVARVFRVRVGKYQQRRDAEAVAAKLEKEEQFKPWITR